ncbi:TPA: type 1 fimbrial protein [Escherichia coli]|nr:type 1 fimbrial protein [Escherichia coli]
MKKYLSRFSTLAFFVSSTALAATSAANDSSTATLDFSGKVTSSLCQVSTDDLSKSINLGEISATALNSNGKSPAQSFSVVLNNCATDTGDINYVFSDANGSSDKATYLQPTVGDTSASGVGVYLAKSDGTAVNIGETVTLDVIKGTDGASALPQQTIPLQAYIGKTSSNATVTPGTVNANAIMTIRTVAASTGNP